MTDEPKDNDKPGGDDKPPADDRFNKAVDDAVAKRVAEETAKKPPADPKYEPPPDNIQKQIAYLERDTKNGGKAVEQLISGLIASGVIEANDNNAPSPDQSARIDKMEADNARLKAGIKYQLSEDDIAILDGSPEEIDRKGKYLRDRLDTALAKAVAAAASGEPPKPDDAKKKPDEDNGNKKPDVPPFQKYLARPTDPQEAIKQAEAQLHESIAEGGGFGKLGSG